ncbi:unnamed protein product [Ixodes pacificus]
MRQPRAPMRNHCAANFFQPLYALHLLGHISSSPESPDLQADHSRFTRGTRIHSASYPDLQEEGTKIVSRNAQFFIHLDKIII